VIETRCGARFSAPVQTGPGANPASCTMGTRSFPGVKSDWGVLLTTHPLQVPCSSKSKVIPLLLLWATLGLYRASVPVQRCTLPLPIPLLPPMGRTACTEPQCLYNSALYLYLYLYSPYGPYSLYRASVPVQWCTLTLPKPLLPLWTVQPVQSLSACTTVNFTLLLFTILSESGHTIHVG